MHERRVANLMRFPCRATSRMLARITRTRKIVLLYHSIGNARHSVAAESFSDQMKYLATTANVVPFDRILDDRNSVSELTCAVTFDDGYANVYEKALPILRRFRLPALIYVTAGAISDACQMSCRFPGLFPDEPMLSWEMLSEMVRHGFSVGSHLCEHLDMTSLGREKGLYQLRGSRSMLTGKLQVPCTHFAYPFGRFIGENMRWVAEAGYRSAATVEHKTVASHVDAYRVPRMCVARIHTLDDFKAMLRGDLDYLYFVQKIRNVFGMGYPLLIHDVDTAIAENNP